MHLQNKPAFLNFVEFLVLKNIITPLETHEALSFLDGVDGIISEGTYILGYEGIARYVSGKLSFDELKIFIEENTEVLSEDADARYFFAQSLVDEPKLDWSERHILIGLMPSKYQPFLLERFS